MDVHQLVARLIAAELRMALAEAGASGSDRLTNRAGAACPEAMREWSAAWRSLQRAGAIVLVEDGAGRRTLREPVSRSSVA